MSAELARIQRELKAQRDLESRLRQEGLHVAARLRSAAGRVHATCIDDLNRNLADYEQRVAAAQPAALAEWRHPVWRDYSASLYSLPGSLRAGFVPEEAFPGATPAKNPQVVPLLDTDGALIFTCDSSTARIARSVISTLLVRAAVAEPAQIQFTLLDPNELGAAFPWRSKLPHVRPSGRSASDELAEIIEDIQRINQGVVVRAPAVRDGRQGKVRRAVRDHCRDGLPGGI